MVGTLIERAWGHCFSSRLGNSSLLNKREAHMGTWRCHREWDKEVYDLRFPFGRLYSGLRITGESRSAAERNKGAFDRLKFRGHTRMMCAFLLIHESSRRKSLPRCYTVLLRLLHIHYAMKSKEMPLTISFSNIQSWAPCGQDGAMGRMKISSVNGLVELSNVLFFSNIVVLRRRWTKIRQSVRWWLERKTCLCS